MRPLVGPVPDPAERANSALRRCPEATLRLGAVGHGGPENQASTPGWGVSATAPAGVALAHRDTDSGDLWVAVPVVDTATLRLGGSHARLEVLDVVLGSAADGRCRRVVVVDGRVELPGVPAQRTAATHVARDLPDATLLDVGTTMALVRLRPHRIVLTDHDGVTEISPDDLATSGPDPFADLEGHWLGHLNDPRCQIVPRIATRVCRCLPAERPLLVGLDRAGVDLEVTGRDGRIHRERLPFAEACTVARELGTQLRLLAGASRYPLDRAALRP